MSEKFTAVVTATMAAIAALTPRTLRGVVERDCHKVAEDHVGVQYEDEQAKPFATPVVVKGSVHWSK